MSKVRITTLCCNTVMTSAGLLAEHGQSFLIETPDAQLLFDAGQSDVAVRNAVQLKKDLSKTTHVVLSHGHYDHAGGLGALLDVHSGNSGDMTGISSGDTIPNLTANSGHVPKIPDRVPREFGFKLIAHPDAFADKQAFFPDGNLRAIGILPPLREKIAAAGIEIVEAREPMEIVPGIWTTGVAPMRNGFEKIEPIFMVKTEKGVQPDPLEDDLSLIVKSEKGAVLLLGCAHRGIVNHLERAAEIAGVSEFAAVIGGMHLERAPQEQIDKTIEALKKYNVKSIVPSHCTGPRATSALMSALPDKVFPNFVGYSFSI